MSKAAPIQQKAAPALRKKPAPAKSVRPAPPSAQTNSIARKPGMPDAEAIQQSRAYGAAKFLGDPGIVNGVKTKPAVQRSIPMGKPGDRFEVEADAMADKVMQMPEPSAQPREQAPKQAQSSDLAQRVSRMEDQKASSTGVQASADEGAPAQASAMPQAMAQADESAQASAEPARAMPEGSPHNKDPVQARPLASRKSDSASPDPGLARKTIVSRKSGDQQAAQSSAAPDAQAKEETAIQKMPEAAQSSVIARTAAEPDQNKGPPVQKKCAECSAPASSDGGGGSSPNKGLVPGVQASPAMPAQRVVAPKLVSRREEARSKEEEVNASPEGPAQMMTDDGEGRRLRKKAFAAASPETAQSKCATCDSSAQKSENPIPAIQRQAESAMSMADKPVQSKCASCEGSAQKSAEPATAPQSKPEVQMQAETAMSSADESAQTKCTACDKGAQKSDDAAQASTAKEQVSSANLDSQTGPPRAPPVAGKKSDTVPDSVEKGIQSSKGGGQPLQKGTQNFMESRFGADFSGVRIHTDGAAAQMSSAIGARAFAHGGDIYFANGQFNPETSEGRHLLAHELTHTLQQGAARPKVQREEAAQTQSSEPQVSRYGWDDFVNDVSDAADAVVDAAEDVGEALGDAAEAVGDAISDAAQALVDAGVEIIDAISDAAKAAIDWLLTAAGAAAKALVAMLGGTIRITSAGLEVIIPQVCPIDALTESFKIDPIKEKFKIAKGAFIIPPDIVVEGVLNGIFEINPDFMAQIGPFCLEGAHLLINPLTNTYQVSGAVSATVAALIGAQVTAGIEGLLKIGALVPVGPVLVPVTFPVVGVQGGVAGKFQAIGAARLTLGGSLGYSAGTIAAAQTRSLDLGLAGDLYLGAYAQLNVKGEDFCRLYWEPYSWHGDVGVQLNIGAGVAFGPGGSASAVGMAGIRNFPYSELPVVLDRAPGFKDDCPIKDKVCKFLNDWNLFPSQNGGKWNWGGPYGPGPKLSGPEPVYTRNPGITSGALCRGACGVDCNGCEPAIPRKYFVDAKTGEVWEYHNYTVCPTATGCQEHDAAFDWAADTKGEVGHGFLDMILPWHMLANLECVCNFPALNCISWAMGGLPKEGEINFADVSRRINPPPRPTSGQYGSDYVHYGVGGASGAPGELWLDYQTNCAEEARRATGVVQEYRTISVLPGYVADQYIQRGSGAAFSFRSVIYDSNVSCFHFHNQQAIPPGVMQTGSLSILGSDCGDPGGQKKDCGVTEAELKACDAEGYTSADCKAKKEKIIKCFGDKDRDRNRDPDSAGPRGNPRPDDAPIHPTYRLAYNRLDSLVRVFRARGWEAYLTSCLRKDAAVERDGFGKKLYELNNNYKRDYRDLRNNDASSLKAKFLKDVDKLEEEVKQLNAEIIECYRRKTGSDLPADQILEDLHKEGTEIWRKEWEDKIFQVNRVFNRLWPPAKTDMNNWIAGERASHPYADLSGEISDLTYIGSTAGGTKGPPKQFVRFNPDNFDVDANFFAPALVKWTQQIKSPPAPIDKQKIFGLATGIPPVLKFVKDAGAEISAIPGFTDREGFDIAIMSQETASQGRDRMANLRMFHLRDILPFATYQQMIAELQSAGLVSRQSDPDGKDLGLRVKPDLTVAELQQFNQICDKYDPGPSGGGGPASSGGTGPPGPPTGGGGAPGGGATPGPSSTPAPEPQEDEVDHSEGVQRKAMGNRLSQGQIAEVANKKASAEPGDALSRKEEAMKQEEAQASQVPVQKAEEAQAAAEPMQKKEEVQTSIPLGKPGDRYEVEADAMADKVMQMPGTSRVQKSEDKVQGKEGEKAQSSEEPVAAKVSRLVSRKEEEGAAARCDPLQRKCSECETESLAHEGSIMGHSQPGIQLPVQKTEEAQSTPGEDREDVGDKQSSTVPGEVESKIRSSKGGGQPLDPGTKGFMEERFGADFSNVRIHNDGDAASMASGIKAQAFAHGKDIYFAPGKYNPSTSSGRHLLAHELTHTIQQGASKEKKTGGDSEDKAQGKEQVQERAETGEQISKADKEEEDWEAELREADGEQQKAVDPLPAQQETKKAMQPNEKELKGKPAKGKDSKGKDKAKGEVAAAPKPKKKGKAASAPRPVDPELGPVGQKLTEKSEKVCPDAEEKTTELADNEKTHDDAGEKLAQTEEAVVPPEEEGQAMGNADHVDKAEGKSEPAVSEEAAKSELNTAIEDSVPSDIKGLNEFKSKGKASVVGARVMKTVNKDVDAVKGTYNEIEKPAQPAPPSNIPQPLPPTEQAPATPKMDLGKDAVPAPTAEQTDMSKFDKESDDQMKKEGIDDERLNMVDSGDLADAKKERKGLKEKVKTAPGKLQAAATVEQKKVDSSLKKEEAKSRAELKTKRNLALKDTKGKQQKTKTELEKKREAVTQHIQGIFNKAKTSVTGKLNALELVNKYAFAKGQAAASKTFEDEVNRDINAWKRRRYSGIFGGAKWLKDKFFGIADFPEVQQAFDKARARYIDRIDALIAEINKANQKVIADCKQELADAKKDIQKYVKSLGPELKAAGKAAQADMNKKLADLDGFINQKQKELTEKLCKAKEQAIKDIDKKIEAMKSEMSGLLSKLGALLLMALKKFFEWALKAAGKDPKPLLDILDKGAAVIGALFKDPIGFLKNLCKSVGQGIEQFSNNIKKHLLSGLTTWLTGAMGDVQITLPEVWDLKGILHFILQLLGLTWNMIRAKLVKRVGEKPVSMAEKTVDVIKRVVTDGPIALWEWVKEKASDIKEQVFGGIRDWVVTTLVKKAILKLVSMLNPVGAIVQGIIMIFDTVMFFVQNWQQIVDFVSSIFDSISNIAAGKVSAAANFIEKAMARTIPIILGFLAQLIGLGGIGKAVQKTVNAIRKPVDKAVDKALDFMEKMVRKMFGGKGKTKEQKDKGKYTQKDKDNALKGVRAEEKKRTEEGAITKEKAIEVANISRNKHPVFKEIKVIDKGESWGYEYAFRAVLPGPKKAKSQLKKKAEGFIKTCHNNVKKGLRSDMKQIIADPAFVSGQSFADFKAAVISINHGQKFHKAPLGDHAFGKPLINKAEARLLRARDAALSSITDPNSARYKDIQEKLSNKKKRLKSLKSYRRKEIHAGGNIYDPALRELQNAIFAPAQETNALNLLEAAFVDALKGGSSAPPHTEYQPVIISSTTDPNTHKTTLKYKYATGKQVFTVVYDSKTGETDQVLGENIAVSVLNRGKTEGLTAEWHNRSHLVADEIQGSGYKTAHNLVMTSAYYNQKEMRGAEQRLGKMLAAIGKPADPVTHFSLKVDVTWETPSTKLAIADIRNAMTKRKNDIAGKTGTGYADEFNTLVALLALSDTDLATKLSSTAAGLGNRRVMEVRYLVTSYTQSSGTVTSPTAINDKIGPDHFFGMS